jgi:hypothetical protein
LKAHFLISCAVSETVNSVVIDSEAALQRLSEDCRFLHHTRHIFFIASVGIHHPKHFLHFLTVMSVQVSEGRMTLLCGL